MGLVDPNCPLIRPPYHDAVLVDVPRFRFDRHADVSAEMPPQAA